MRILCRPLCLLLGCLILAVSPAWADDTTHAVSIPAGDLKAGLELLMKQTGVELVYRPEQVSGLKTQGAQGTLKAEQAVARLLAGTPLVLNKDASGALLIAPQAARAVNDPPDVAKQSPNGKADKEGKKPSSQDFRVAQVDQTAAGPQVGQGSDEEKKKYVLQEIVVTGSHLAGTPQDEGQELLTYGHEQINDSGQTSVAEFLNTVTDVSVSSSQIGLNTGGGAGTVQLHGLPIGTTLVLINGRPVEPNGTQAFFGINMVDLDTIPLAAVDRIDVLPAGSSAIYGSDALAGVVNIVLKTDFDGVEANYKHGGASDTSEQDANVTWGKRWGRGSLTVVASYMDRGELEGFDRTLSANQDYTAYGGPDSRTPFCIPNNVYSVNGSPLPGLGTATYAAVPKGFAGTPSIAEFQSTAGTLNTCGLEGYSSLIPESQRLGFYLSGKLELTPSVEAFTELLVSQTRVTQGGPPPVLFGVVGFQQFTVSAANPYNPFGETVGISGLVSGAGRGLTEYPVTFLRPLLGLRGDLFSSWQWEVVGYEAADRSSNTLTNFRNAAGIQAGLNSSNPATALNPFIDGPLGTPSQISSEVIGESDSITTHASRVAGSGLLRGPAFDLPAGPVQVALGAEYDKDKLSYAPNNATSLAALGAPFTYQRSLYSAYAEARIPILSRARNPDSSGTDDVLALTGAVREDHYASFGGKVTPQVSLALRPSRAILVRGSYGQAFRAPTLTELYTPTTSGLGSVSDPQNGGQTEFVTVTNGGNAHLKPETGFSETAGIVYSSEALHGLHLSLNYWRVSEQSTIQQLNQQVIVDYANYFPGAVTRNSSGIITSVDSTFLNFGSIDVRGLDYHADYRIPTAWGDFTPSISATQTTHYTAAFVPGVPAVDNLNQANDDGQWAPRWKLVAGLGWKLGPVSSSLTGRYVGRYRDYDPLLDGSYLTQGNFWLCDGNVRYVIGRTLAPSNGWLSGTYLEAGGVNLFNRLPQYSNYFGGTIGFDAAQADIRGRFLYAQLGLKW